MGNEKSKGSGNTKAMGGMLTASIALGEDIESVALFEDIEEQVVEVEEEIDDSPPDPRKKVLMLGCGDSGKTTFYKHAKAVVTNNEFIEEYRKTFIDIIHYNILRSIKQLVSGVYEIDVPITRDEKLLQYFAEMEDDLVDHIATIWNDVLVDDIINVWNNDSIQEVFKVRHKLHQNFSGGALKHYMDKIYAIKSAEYIPTVQDILYMKAKTTGVHEFETSVEETVIRLMDTGGQRNERKKWLQEFKRVNCIVFTAALPEYATLCYEDEETNRLVESLTTFERIVNHDKFIGVPIILLLTKPDQLCHTTQQHSLKSLFPEFSGRDNSCIDVISFICQKFLQQYQGDEVHKIFPIVVNSLDRNVVHSTLSKIYDITLAGTSREYQPKLWNMCQFVYRPIFSKAKITKAKFLSDVSIVTQTESKSADNRGDWSPTTPFSPIGVSVFRDEF